LPPRDISFYAAIFPFGKNDAGRRIPGLQRAIAPGCATRFRSYEAESQARFF
jgi:hypothetical protein